MKKLNVKILTKQLNDSVAKELVLRAKKIEGGIAVRRGQIKGRKENGIKLGRRLLTV